MTARLLSQATAALLSAFLFGTAPAAIAAPATEPGAAARAAAGFDAAAVDSVVRGYLAATGLPGAAVTITHGTRVLHAAGYGRTATGDPVTAHTALPVASLSKSFTALAVVQLAESGRLDLDRPVRAYLPEFTMADPRAERITVRQLLDQTSGLSDTTFPSFTRPQPNTLAESVASMRQHRLAADPGTRWEYHNPNFQLAARLVEVVSGQDFNAYLDRHIFTPLGMTDSRTHNTADEIPSPFGHLLVLGRPVALPEPPAFGNGSGGMLSSAHDLAAWLIAQNNQGRSRTGTPIARPESITATHTPSPASGSYALGWSTTRTDSGTPLIAHGGDLFTATAYQALLPRTGHGIAVLANTGTTHADAPALARSLLALLENRPIPTPANPLLLTDAALLALTLLAILLTARGLRRSRHWAHTRKTPKPPRPSDATPTGSSPSDATSASPSPSDATSAGSTPSDLSSASPRPAEPRRSTRATGARIALRLFPYLLPVALLLSLHRVVGLLYRGRDIAWLQVAYLYPTFLLFLATATLGCLLVLAARLIKLRSVPHA